MNRAPSLPPEGPRPMIRVRGFSMRFGRLQAVDNLELDIPAGEIFGFIGPNGAGKSTTIRFLATLLSPQRGEAWINGCSVTRQADQVRRLIGYMPDSFGLYEGMKVREFLDFFALAYGLRREKRRRTIAELLHLLDLEGKSDDPVAGLSRGMRQRLCLARTLVHDPPVLILDEPASGLDPRARIEMKELLLELQRMGKTIFISSHILSELKDCCSRLGILERGKLVACGTLDEIFRLVRRHLRLRLSVLAREQELEWLLRHDERVRELSLVGGEFTVTYDGTLEDLQALHARIVAAGLPLLWFAEREPDLEEAFLKITRGEVA